MADLTAMMQAAAGNAAQVTPGQVVFVAGMRSVAAGGTTQETYSWVVPDGVTSISAVVIGAGRCGVRSDSAATGGVGGGLRYINGLAVTPGETLTINVGKGVGDSTLSFAGGTTEILRGGTTLIRAAGAVTSTAIGGNIGGGDGGAGGISTSTNAGGGGGAGGYAGNGGSGQSGGGSYAATPTANSGAAFGGRNSSSTAQGGGGVGLVKRGVTGSNTGEDFQPGSRGYTGTEGTGQNFGIYGGGGGGNDSSLGFSTASSPGGCRIIWGADRTYPEASDDYWEFTDTAYSQIEVRIYIPNIASLYPGAWKMTELRILDENFNNFLPGLTAVAGSSSVSFSSISTGQFTFKTSASLSSAQVGLLNDGDLETGVPNVFQINFATPLSIFIKPSTAKKIKGFNIVTGNVSDEGVVHYVEIYGDSELISNGSLIPQKNINTGYWDHSATVE